MSVFKQHYKTIVGSILLAVGAISYLDFRGEKSTAPSPTEARLTPPRLTKASQTSETPAALKPEQLTRAATRGLPPASPEVQKLLPGITEAVKNWKEFKPKKLVIAPYPDTPMEFEEVSVREENGRTIWTGRNALQGAFLTTVATENDWLATLVIPPVGAFDIQISGQNVTVQEKNHEDERCGVSVAMNSPNISAHDSSTSTAIMGSINVADPDTTLFVDVLFFYDADTLAKVGTQDLFNSRMMLYIESSNTALVNSAVTNYRWRFLASYQAPAYTTTNDMGDDLDMISATKNKQILPTQNPVSAFVSDKATLHGADQVVLYVGGTRNYAGIAWISPSRLQLHTAVVEWGTSYMVVAHELGHGFGCRHDRQTEAATDGDGQFYYGHRFLDKSNNDTGTIMSYANFRYPYYSNPAITYNGYAMGVADDQPKAADNARVLREAALTLSNSRPAVDAPAITTQPQSVSVVTGQPFTLSVIATGSNPTYQWKLAGTDIAGATSTSFSKATSVAADAGSYTVVVANIAGSVTSNTATVTVTDPAPVTPTPTPAAAAPAASSGGGGGGGGGSANAVFTILCGLLFLLRWKFKSQH